MTARFLVGDVFERLAELPDASVDMVLTSPPFLALRSYLPPDHADKAKEIGSEPNPAQFLDVMFALSAELRRVLAPHGSMCIELGDTYSGSGGSGGDYNVGGLREGQNIPVGPAKRAKLDDAGAWPLNKSLCLIPELYRVGLAYGINPLTGGTSAAGRWRVRNVVRWHRPNPPVGALGDKFRPSTSDMVIACKSRTRYFDLDAVRDELTERAMRELENPVLAGESYRADPTGNGYGDRVRKPSGGGGAPPLDTWIIPTQGYKGSHYATYPEALCVKPIKSMVPERVCLTCGLPSERIVEVTPEYQAALDATNGQNKTTTGQGANPFGGSWPKNGDRKTTVTTGWSDCGHNTWRTGVVLDPFAGSGTTLAVAQGHGRDAIGIDLDERNADLARERVGMFLEVEG